VQVYDISFELNEVEARMEEYPSTLSYLKLHNVFIANETDTSDKGVRYV
jgi:nuclear pore complex protein Nup205